jgi:hypothetical protein
MFSSQNRARALNTRLALATTKKGNSTIAEFVNKMKVLGDQMVAAGRLLEEEEFVEYILTGLDSDFNPIVSALIARKETVTVSEAYQQMLAFETRMDMLGLGQSGSSANTANHGGFGNGGGRGYNGSHGGGHGYNGGGRGNGSRATSTTISVKAATVVAAAVASSTRTPTVPSLSVRCASRKDTPQIGAGTDLRRTMFLKRSMYQQP